MRVPTNTPTAIAFVFICHLHLDGGGREETSYNKTDRIEQTDLRKGEATKKATIIEFNKRASRALSNYRRVFPSFRPYIVDVVARCLHVRSQTKTEGTIKHPRGKI